jgi:hypothetical protein
MPANRLVEFVAYYTEPNGHERKLGGALGNVNPYITEDELKVMLSQKHDTFIGMPPDKFSVKIVNRADLSPQARVKLSEALSGSNVVRGAISGAAPAPVSPAAK